MSNATKKKVIKENCKAEGNLTVVFGRSFSERQWGQKRIRAKKSSSVDYSSSKPLL
jgi:hypothetical protein